jgi:hypothetical protein
MRTGERARQELRDESRDEKQRWRVREWCRQRVGMVRERM